MAEFISAMLASGDKLLLALFLSAI